MGNTLQELDDLRYLRRIQWEKQMRPRHMRWDLLMIVVGIVIVIRGLLGV